MSVWKITIHGEIEPPKNAVWVLGVSLFGAKNVYLNNKYHLPPKTQGIINVKELKLITVDNLVILTFDKISTISFEK